jgi:hypothetical protein
MSNMGFEDIDEKKNIVHQGTDEERKLLRIYETEFISSMTARKSKETLWTELDTFDRGEQWKGQAVPPWVPKPVDNWIRYVRQLKRANLASSIPRPTFTPINVMDFPQIQKFQFGHDHVWEHDCVPRTIRRCIDRAILQGTAVAYVYEDDTEVGGKYHGEDHQDNNLYSGEIKVRRFPITNFFPDPDAYRLNEAKFIETTELLPLNTIKNNPAFKDYCGKKLDDLNGYFTDKDGGSGTILNRDTDPTNNLGHVTDDYLVTLHAHWKRFLNEHGRWQLDVTYYIRNVPFFLLFIKDVEPNEYPFAILYDEEEEQDFWGTSECMTIMESQKTINKADQTAAIIGILNQNPQKVVLRESGINAQDLARSGTMPGKVWVSNVPNAIEPIEPPDIPKGLFELRDRIGNNIKDRVGVNEAYTGNSVGSLTTSTGVSDLIERATIRDRDKMIQIDEFVERISHLIVCFMVHKWKEERPLAVSTENGSTAHDTWSPLEDPENFAWRVKVDTYAKAPTTQASRRQQADKLMQMQGQFQFSPAIITPEEWIMLQDFDNKDQILARMQKDREMLQQQVAQQAKIPQGDVKISLGSSDPNVIFDYLQEQKQAAVQNAQIQAQVQASHAPGGAPQGNVQGDSQAPQGVTSQVAMSNMANGG